MNVQGFVEKLCNTPETIDFQEVIAMVADNYQYRPAEFSNGEGEDRVINEAGSNEDSCKIFAFGGATLK